MFDLKDNFVNKQKNLNARRFINSQSLKWYETHRLKNFSGSKFLNKTAAKNVPKIVNFVMHFYGKIQKFSVSVLIFSCTNFNFLSFLPGIKKRPENGHKYINEIPIGWSLAVKIKKK